MSTPSRIDSLHPKAQEGITLFDQGSFYEAHEPLEEAWMETPSPERDLYQGILQIGLAYYQITRGNYRGALKMFSRGQRNLRPLGDSLLGVNLKQLREDAYDIEDSLRQLEPAQIGLIDPGSFKPIPFLS